MPTSPQTHYGGGDAHGKGYRHSVGGAGYGSFLGDDREYEHRKDEDPKPPRAKTVFQSVCLRTGEATFHSRVLPTEYVFKIRNVRPLEHAGWFAFSLPMAEYLKTQKLLEKAKVAFLEAYMLVDCPYMITETEVVRLV